MRDQFLQRASPYDHVMELKDPALVNYGYNVIRLSLPHEIFGKITILARVVQRSGHVVVLKLNEGNIIKVADRNKLH